ncbi:MAG: hypothetical protein ABFS56_20965 [Pseudomonadota bacterium]
MTFEPELRETEQGIEIRLNYQAPDSGKSFSFYIFAANGITEPDDSLGEWLKVSHVGNANRPAILCHLGCNRLGVQLGDETLFGAKKAQEEALSQFIAELPKLSGEYGSWWGETLRLLETHLSDYACFKLSLYYFGNEASKAPFEWDQERFENWINRQQNIFNPAKKTFEFHLICRSPATETPFYNSPSVVKKWDLRDFLNEVGKDGGNKSVVCLYVKRKNLEKPITLSENWKLTSQKANWVWFCSKPVCKDQVIGVIPNAKMGDVGDQDITIK